MKSNLLECFSVLQNDMASILLGSPEIHMPLYNEIGKKSRDLFTTGFYFGVLSLDVKNHPRNNVELSTSWTENIQESRLYGTVEAKYHLAEYNLALTEKLNKNCFLNTDVSYKSKLLKGLIISLGGFFSPSAGLKTGLLKTEWSGRYCSATSDLEIGKNLSLLTSSVVLGSRGIFAGLQWKFDFHKDMQSDLHFVFGYASDDFCVHTCMNTKGECHGAVYHRVAPELEIGVDVKWLPNSTEPHFGVAGRYVLDNGISIRGKISNNNDIGLSYEQKLNDGITLTMSTLFDMRTGKHKSGLGLRLEL